MAGSTPSEHVRLPLTRRWNAVDIALGGTSRGRKTGWARSLAATEPRFVLCLCKTAMVSMAEMTGRVRCCNMPNCLRCQLSFRPQSRLLRARARSAPRSLRVR